MPLSSRILDSPLTYAPPDRKHVSDSREDYVLEGINVLTMRGVMAQCAALTRHACDLFSDVQTDAVATFDRIKRTSNRIDGILEQCTALSETQRANAQLAKTDAMEAHSKTSHFLFMRQSLPSCLKTAVAAAAPIPDFALVAGSENHSDKYSNPEFFMQMFIEAERQRQEEALERRRKRQEGRSRRRQAKEATRVNKTRVQVAAVEKKKYNVFGAEFSDEEMNLEAPLGRAEEENHVLISTFQESHKKLVDSKFNVPDIPPPPPLQQQIEMPPVEPEELPEMPQMQEAYSREASPSPVRTGAVRPVREEGDLFKAADKSLASAPPAAASAVPDLLSQIRKGKDLKRVQPAKPPASKQQVGGTMGELMMLLERRKFIDDSGSDDDDDWDQ